MKTKLIILLFSFFVFQLNAQFHFKVSMDEEGLYSVKVKSDVALNPGSIVGVGKISLTTPKGGFKMGDITSVNGNWTENPDVLTDDYYGFSLDKDYFFVNILDGDGMVTDGLKEGEEITLMTFRNVGVCTGAIELFNNEDDRLVAIMDSLCILDQELGIITEYELNPINDLTTFDPIAQQLYKVIGNYGIGQANCQLENNHPLLEEDFVLEIQEPANNYVTFKWTALPNADYYELKGRKKGSVEWAKRIITSTATAYLYAADGKEFEYQVIAHQKKKITKSKVTDSTNK